MSILPLRIRFRFRRHATDARLVAPLPTDARPAGENHGRKKQDPELERRKRIRRGVALFVLAMIFMAGTAAALFGERGYRDVRRSGKELDKLQRDVDEELTRLLELKSEVKRLQKDPTAIERIAREQLGFSKKGEIQFLLPWDEEQDGLGEGPRKLSSEKSPE